MPQVSIVIPAYNPGSYLRTALESIHCQTVDAWDVTVIDDESPQDLSWIERDFPRVRYIRQPHGGASIARNNGILRTAGDFIAFMDQDDVWKPEKLARQLEAMRETPSAGVCYCDLELIDAAGNSTESHDGDLSGPAREVLLDPANPPAGVSPMLASLRHFSRNFIVPSTVMIRRHCLAVSGLLDPFIPFSADYDLLIKLGSRFPVVHVSSTDVMYRKHANNFSDKYEVGRAEVSALIGRYEAYGRATADTQLFKEAGKLFRRPRKVYAAQAFDCARRSYNLRDYRATSQHLSWAIRFSPAFALGSMLKWFRNRRVRAAGRAEASA